MGNARLSNAFGALGEGLALFAGRKYEEEDRRIEKQWDMALEKMRAQRADARETRAIERETAREDKADTRYLAGQETQRQATAATAEYRKDTLAQSRDTLAQSDVHFDKTQAAREDESLRKRLSELDDRRMEELKASMGLDEGGAIAARYGEQRDNDISAHVIRMASAKAPGYKRINSQEALASKMIQMGMDAEGADMFAPSIWADLSGEPQPEPIAKRERTGNYQFTNPDGTVETGPNYTGPRGTTPDLIPAPQPGGAPPNTAAASQVNMVAPGGGVPPQAPAWRPGDTPVAGEPLFDPNLHLGEQIQKFYSTPGVKRNPNENPYAMMGQRR